MLTKTEFEMEVEIKLNSFYNLLQFKFVSHTRTEDSAVSQIIFPVFEKVSQEINIIK